LVTGADIAAAKAAAEQITVERNGFHVDQFRDINSVRFHEEGTVPELWKQLAGAVDGFTACVGSGGTFVGTVRFLKRQRAAVVCAAVKLLQSGRLRFNATVATILCDTGLKLSSVVF
jgi:cysteine synthase